MVADVLTLIAIACLAWAIYAAVRRGEQIEPLVFAAFGFTLLGRWDAIGSWLGVALFAGAIVLRWRAQRAKGRVP